MTEKLYWLEREQTITYEHMWRDHITGMHYVADAPRDAFDTRVMSRTLTVDRGTIVGARPDLGETTYTSGEVPTTRVETEPVISDWAKVSETRGTA